MAPEVPDFKSNAEEEFVASPGIRGRLVGFENYKSGFRNHEGDTNQNNPDLIYICMTKEMLERNITMMNVALHSVRHAEKEAQNANV